VPWQWRYPVTAQSIKDNIAQSIKRKGEQGGAVHFVPQVMGSEGKKSVEVKRP
jgi:hypothetical protein